MKTSLLPWFLRRSLTKLKGLIMSGGVAYVVQDLESYMFLCEQDGDVGYTPELHVLGVSRLMKKLLIPEACLK
jgi:hypothetical protein